MLDDLRRDGLQLVLSSTVSEGVHVEVSPAVALPANPQDWLDQILADRVIVDVVHLTTVAGWPVTVVHTRSADLQDTRRTLLAFYELFDRGVVVTMIARDAAHLAAERDSIHAFVRAADIDRAPREVVARAQLWEAS